MRRTHGAAYIVFSLYVRRDSLCPISYSLCVCIENHDVARMVFTLCVRMGSWCKYCVHFVLAYGCVIRPIMCFLCACLSTHIGERTGLVVRAWDSGSGDPGSILGRVGVLFP